MEGGPERFPLPQGGEGEDKVHPPSLASYPMSSLCILASGFCAIPTGKDFPWEL